MEMVISSTLGTQPPLDIVHLNVLVEPMVSPVTVVVGELGAVIVAVPLITLQVPLPLVGVLADSWVVVTLHKL